MAGGDFGWRQTARTDQEPRGSVPHLVEKEEEAAAAGILAAVGGRRRLRPVSGDVMAVVRSETRSGRGPAREGDGVNALRAT